MYPEAYLKSKMTELNVPVYMVIDTDMAKLLCQLDPSYKNFLTNKGEVLVKLDRALYGLCEAGLKWYNNINGALEEIVHS